MPWVSAMKYIIVPEETFDHIFTTYIDDSTNFLAEIDLKKRSLEEIPDDIIEISMIRLGKMPSILQGLKRQLEKA